MKDERAATQKQGREESKIFLQQNKITFRELEEFFLFSFAFLLTYKSLFLKHDFTNKGGEKYFLKSKIGDLLMCFFARMQKVPKIEIL